MNKNEAKLSDLEKMTILSDYYASGHSIYACAKANGILRSTLSRWIKKYPFETESVSLPEDLKEEIMAKKKVNESVDEIARLQARIRTLEKALAFSRLEIQARDLLIDVAEKQEKIQIRKKSGVR
jgi:transposase